MLALTFPAFARFFELNCTIETDIKIYLVQEAGVSEELLKVITLCFPRVISVNKLGRVSPGLLNKIKSNRLQHM